MKETSVLNFTVSSGSSDIGLVEIDPILNVDSEGNAKSSFSEGEEIYIAVHFDPDKYVLSNFFTTTGSLLYVGKQRTYRKIESLFFQESTSTISYIIDGIKEITWYGPTESVSYSYNVLTSSLTPVLIDISIYTFVEIFKYIPSDFVDLTKFDSFPVGIVFNLESL